MKLPSVGCLKLVDELEAATCISVLPLSHRSVPDRAKLHWDGAANYVICKPSDMRAARELPMSFISVGREVGRKKICLACSHDGIFTLKSVGISSTLPLPVQTTAPCVTNFLSSSKKKTYLLP
jgi:hypothetical protein